jgi:hypothetical protein
MLQAYKLNKEHQYYKLPRVFVIDEDSGYTIASANCTEPTRYGVYIGRMINEGYLYRIDIYKEKWVHPHLIKKLKQDLEISN